MRRPRRVRDFWGTTKTAVLKADTRHLAAGFGSIYSVCIGGTRVSASSIIAKNSTVSRNEDTVIALLLEGAATDSHFAVTGFQVTQLPTNGTLYLDFSLSQFRSP